MNDIKTTKNVSYTTLLKFGLNFKPFLSCFLKFAFTSTAELNRRLKRDLLPVYSKFWGESSDVMYTIKNMFANM